MNTALISFYLNEGADSRGRYFRDIVAWEDPNEWEKCHDFIQWVFPLPEASRFNPDAPLLDPDTLEVFRSSQGIQINAGKAYIFAQRFLWQQKETSWLKEGDHNHLRITRIIRFFNLIGFEKAARHVYNNVVQLASTRPGVVSETTLDFWALALNLKDWQQ